MTKRHKRGSLADRWQQLFDWFLFTSLGTLLNLMTGPLVWCDYCQLLHRCFCLWCLKRESSKSTLMTPIWHVATFTIQQHYQHPHRGRRHAVYSHRSMLPYSLCHWQLQWKPLGTNMLLMLSSANWSALAVTVEPYRTLTVVSLPSWPLQCTVHFLFTVRLTRKRRMPMLAWVEGRFW